MDIPRDDTYHENNQIKVDTWYECHGWIFTTSKHCYDNHGKNAGNLQNKHTVSKLSSARPWKKIPWKRIRLPFGARNPFFSYVREELRSNMFNSPSLVEGFLSLFCMLIYLTLSCAGSRSGWVVFPLLMREKPRKRALVIYVGGS